MKKSICTREMPVVVARFLATPAKEGFKIYDKFVYLIKSVDGDSYYLHEQLLNEGYISEELGSKAYDAVANGITYKDILNWYEPPLLTLKLRSGGFLCVNA